MSISTSTTGSRWRKPTPDTGTDGHIGKFLKAAIAAAQAGTHIFPISASTYMEVSKIGSPKQRRDLRRVIEQVSRFQVVADRTVTVKHEIEALLDSLIGPSPTPIRATDYVDWGVARAFGMRGGFRVIAQDGVDVTAETRRTFRDGPGAWDALMFNAELDLNRKVLEGPTDADEPELRAQGFDPSVAFQIAKQRADQELDQAKVFSCEPRWRRGRIRDVIAVREIEIEYKEPLFSGIEARGAGIQQLFPGPDEIRRATDALPSVDVAVTLKTALHRNPQHRWKPNDIFDIDILSSTIPYCDVVVTDRAMVARAGDTGLASRLETVVLSNLADLAEQLG